ncbi:Signal transduction histidine kinase CheA [Pseudomonas sp. SHC52]|nr:Signal transduction histidine kinase CheA [Pseudomonas sp. SHC52]
MLDQLHGKGTFAVDALESAIASTPAPSKPAAAAAGSDLITDQEFESLLDDLHGKGKFSEVGTGSAAPAAAPAAKAAPKPAAKAPEPKAETPAPAPKPAAAAAPAPARAPAASAPAEKPTSEAETTVRVDTARLDEIMNMVGELVLVRNRLVRLGLNSQDEAMSKAVSNLDVVTADLQTAVMKTRMQPIKKVFGRFPRLVRDLARQLKKEINLELVGEETDLDKNLVEALADPLVHLVRNAVDHGIESPEEREAAGKVRSGKVILAAEQEGDHILLSISDDGKGMDPEVLRAIAVKRGVMDKDAADRLSDTECYNLIFAPGFSTKTEISDVSGRGVGMDVVKTKISQLNGSINIHSVKGSGSKILIKVPLTLAIMPTLMVMLGNQAFAFPLVNVNEIFHLDLSRTNVVDGQEVVIVRDKALPLFYLKRWLVSSAAHVEQGEGHVVILSVGTQRIGFVVDQLVGQEEVVIKPLGKMLQGTPGMSGATITGDGRIALILDVPSMLKRYAARRI